MRQLIATSIPLVLSVLLCTVLAGCGSGELKYDLTAVKGTVSYKGKPLENGQIQFIPDQPTKEGLVAGKLAFAKINNGSYSIPEERGATVGKNRVEIVSYHDTGRTTQVEDSVIKVEIQFIPEKYNTSSTLSADVKPGENTLDFDLN